MTPVKAKSPKSRLSGQGKEKTVAANSSAEASTKQPKRAPHWEMSAVDALKVNYVDSEL